MEGEDSRMSFSKMKSVTVDKLPHPEQFEQGVPGKKSRFRNTLYHRPTKLAKPKDLSQKNSSKESGNYLSTHNIENNSNRYPFFNQFVVGKQIAVFRQQAPS